LTASLVAIEKFGNRSYPFRSSDLHRWVSLAGLRVLLVEDDVEQLELLSSLLEHANAEVVTATSAEQALQKLAQRAPDIIVSDINMPECDGYQFLRRVRSRSVQDGGATPAIALTGRTRPEDQTRAFLAGYQLHFSKPLRLLELLVAIRGLGEVTGRRQG
jgi:CheY-like chemotaxis protein